MTLKYYSYSWFHDWIVENECCTSTIFFGRIIFEFVFQITVFRIHFGDIWWFHDQFLNFMKCGIRFEWKINIVRNKFESATRIRRILNLGSKDIQELNLRQHFQSFISVTLTIFSFMLGKKGRFCSRRSYFSLDPWLSKNVICHCFSTSDSNHTYC